MSNKVYFAWAKTIERNDELRKQAEKVYELLYDACGTDHSYSNLSRELTLMLNIAEENAFKQGFDFALKVKD